MVILMIGKCRWPMRKGCSGMAIIPTVGRPLPSEGKAHTLESCRVRHKISDKLEARRLPTCSVIPRLAV